VVVVDGAGEAVAEGVAGRVVVGVAVEGAAEVVGRGWVACAVVAGTVLAAGVVPLPEVLDGEWRGTADDVERAAAAVALGTGLGVSGRAVAPCVASREPTPSPAPIAWPAAAAVTVTARGARLGIVGSCPSRARAIPPTT
jgi:hypothetical protein